MKNNLNLTFLIFAALVFAHEPALAANGLQSLSTVGSTIVDQLTLAMKWIGTGGLMIAGIMYLSGKFGFDVLVKPVIGLAICASAGWIVQLFGFN